MQFYRLIGIVLYLPREEHRLHELRRQYENFLEEEKRRKERNKKILQTLERVESRATILTAKSERLKLLRVCMK